MNETTPLHTSQEVSSPTPERQPRYEVETLWAFDVNRFTHKDISLVETMLGIRLWHFSEPNSFVLGSKFLTPAMYGSDSEPILLSVRRKSGDNGGISIVLETALDNYEGKTEYAEAIEREKSIVQGVVTLLGGSEVELAV